jgi:nitrite reductase/ring-hydroxylating ferredoxin subunit
VIERWARPLSGLWNGIADVSNAVYRALGAPGKYLQDFLNGSWLGHPVHAVVVDVVVGGATIVVVLDVLRFFFNVAGLEDALIWSVGLVSLAGVGAIVAGLTDFKDTATGDERNVTGLHGVINIIGIVLFALSFFLRLGGAHDTGFWLFLIGYLVISVGAYIGGHVVFKYGYMVNRSAFAPTTLVLVRRGEVVNALKETCSHAGGPLAEGTLHDDTIVCPWHQSAFRLSDGRVRHGPATSRQVAYRARINAGQVEIQGPMD